ncbi:MAG: hypothetical protein N4A46_10810, partial [Schleiferiaceae bacterium]|nr:hypothetical protein [Schleiferiaceae bacterium]
NGRITKRESYGKKSNGLIFKRALQEYQYQGNTLTKLYFKRYDETGAIEYQSELNASYDAQKNALESSGDQLLLRDYLGGRTTFYNGLSQNNLVELTEVGTNFYQKLTCDYQYDSEGYPVEFDLKTENSNGISTQHFWLEYY